MAAALDLFSGAGGMALAVHAAFPGLRLWRLCEADAACRELLARRFPGVPCEEDVAAMRGDPGAGVRLVYGGFPCQDVSLVGRRAGVEGGTRSSLFEHMIRLAGECRAPFILMENVAALRTNGLDVVCARLREAGYAEIRWLVLGADEVGMRHRRLRLFLGARNPSLDNDVAPGPPLAISAAPMDALLPLAPEPPHPRVGPRPQGRAAARAWQARMKMLGNCCVPRQGLAAIRALFGIGEGGAASFGSASASASGAPAPLLPATLAWQRAAPLFDGSDGSLADAAAAFGSAPARRTPPAESCRTLLASDPTNMLGRRHYRREDGSYAYMSLLRWARHNPEPGTWGIRRVSLADPPAESVVSLRWAEWLMGFPDGWLSLVSASEFDRC